MALVRAREQVEALEYEAQPFAPDGGEVRFLQARYVDALEEIMAARWPVETSHNFHERRLTRARPAHDRDELARPHDEIVAAERLDLDVAHHEGALHTLDLDDRIADFGAFPRHRNDVRDAAPANHPRERSVPR